MRGPVEPPHQPVSAAEVKPEDESLAAEISFSAKGSPWKSPGVSIFEVGVLVRVHAIKSKAKLQIIKTQAVEFAQTNSTTKGTKSSKEYAQNLRVTSCPWWLALYVYDHSKITNRTQSRSLARSDSHHATARVVVSPLMDRMALSSFFSISKTADNLVISRRSLTRLCRFASFSCPSIFRIVV